MCRTAQIIWLCSNIQILEDRCRRATTTRRKQHDGGWIRWPHIRGWPHSATITRRAAMPQERELVRKQIKTTTGRIVRVGAAPPPTSSNGWTRVTSGDWTITRTRTERRTSVNEPSVRTFRVRYRRRGLLWLSPKRRSYSREPAARWNLRTLQTTWASPSVREADDCSRGRSH